VLVRPNFGKNLKTLHRHVLFTEKKGEYKMKIAITKSAKAIAMFLVFASALSLAG